MTSALGLSYGKSTPWWRLPRRDMAAEAQCRGVDRQWMGGMTQIFHDTFVAVGQASEHSYREATDIFKGMAARTNCQKCAVCGEARDYDVATGWCGECRALLEAALDRDGGAWSTRSQWRLPDVPDSAWDCAHSCSAISWPPMVPWTLPIDLGAAAIQKWWQDGLPDNAGFPIWWHIEEATTSNWYPCCDISDPVPEQEKKKESSEAQDTMCDSLRIEAQALAGGDECPAPLLADDKLSTPIGQDQETVETQRWIPRAASSWGASCNYLISSHFLISS